MSARFGTFVRNPAGIAEVLNGPGTRRAVRAAAERIAGNVSTPDTPRDGVVVDDYQTSGMRTDRPASSVTIRDPRARRWEWSQGVLVRAAAAAGFEVNSR